MKWTNQFSTARNFAFCVLCIVIWCGVNRCGGAVIEGLRAYGTSSVKRGKWENFKRIKSSFTEFQIVKDFRDLLLMKFLFVLWQFDLKKSYYIRVTSENFIIMTQSNCHSKILSKMKESLEKISSDSVRFPKIFPR